MNIKSKLTILAIIVVATLSVFFSGCKIYYWEIGKDISEIDKIEIIDIELDNTNLCCEIDKTHYADLINDLKKLKAHRYFGDPASQSGKIIRISFNNGDVDIISQYEPKHCYMQESGELNKGHISWLYFDKTEFEQLIEKWTTE